MVFNKNKTKTADLKSYGNTVVFLKYIKNKHIGVIMPLFCLIRFDESGIIRVL